MSKIKKLLFSILFMISISFFIQTTSSAVENATYSSEYEISKQIIINNGGFSENIELTGNNILNLNKFSIHHAKNNTKWGWNPNGRKYYWPRLDEDPGVLCLEHNIKSSEEAGVNDDIPVIKWNIQVNGRHQRRNMTSVNGDANQINKGETANSGKIAYILMCASTQNPNGSNEIRKNNGAQGALWKAYMDGSYPNEFPGEPLSQKDIDRWGESGLGAWADMKVAKDIYDAASRYNAYLNSRKALQFQKKDDFQWRLSGDGSSYIIGPFYAVFNENAYADTSMSLNGGVAYTVCDYNGNRINFVSGGTFYIKVSAGALNGTGTITITQDRDNIVAEWWQMRCKDRDQLRIYISRVVKQRLRQTATLTFSTPALTITKVDADDTSKRLPGMQFKIRYGNNLWLASDPRTNNSMPTFSTTGNAVLTTDGNGQIVLPKMYDGNYTIVEVGVGNNWQYEVPKSPNNETKANVNGNNAGVTIKNKKVFIKITGYVWVDRGSDGKETTRDNVYNNGTNDRYLNNVDITLKHKTNANFNNEGRGTTATSSVRIDPDTNQYISYQFVVRRTDLPNLYVEFDYDGLQYQCVTPNAASNGSKAAEGSSRRDPFNANFSTIEGNGDNTGYTLDANGNRSQSLTYTKQNHNSILNNVTTTENSTTVTINNKGNYHILSDTTSANYTLPNPGAGVDIIQNINFGVYERTQPDLSVVKDIQSVRLSINGRNHVYDYSQRINATNNEDTSGFNVGVKFENSYKTKYKRAIYRSDYEYTNTDDASKELQVYITYRIMIKNQSSVVETQPNRIYEYYDKNYELVDIGKELEADGSNTKDKLNTSQYRVDTSYNNGNYTKLIIEPDLGTIGTGQDKSIYVQFHLNREAVIDILNGRENLDNFVEIASYSSIKDGKPYAGVDIDSNPGNASPTDESTVEDDSDVSPTLLLEVANAREMQGTVFVDEALQPAEGIDTSGVMTGQVREGDGIYNPGENTLSGIDVKFEEQVEDENKGVIYETKTVSDSGTYKFRLQYYNAGGELIEDRFERLYVNENNLTETNEETDFSSELPAGTRVVVTPTPVDGTEEEERIYTKELQKGEFFLVGYVPGDYTLTYTWGGQEYQLKINDTETKTEKVTVQNYKGTIYDYDRYLENYVGVDGNEPNKNWYDVDSGTRYTDAIDDYDTRLNIDNDFKTINSTTDRGENYENITTMDSTTPVMNIDVEYKIGETKPVDENSTEIVDRYTNLVENVDFGVIRRAKQSYGIEKRISSMKITLANSRVLADLKVVEKDGKRVLEGTKTGATYMEPSSITTPKNGLLRFEMDSELIQGARVELTYDIVIRNLSELDYVDENFYNFGKDETSDENSIVKIIPSKIVDYLDDDWGFEDAKNKDESNKSIWQVKAEEDVGIDKEDISDPKIAFTLIEDVLKSQGFKKSQKLYSDYCSEESEALAPGSERTINLNVSKILSSSQDIELNNELEIVEIKKNGGSDIEEYINPGNYEPSLGGDITTDEIDDDIAETLTITPNTGENRNYTLPIVITLTAFVVLIGGIIFIKKKILNK